MRELRSDGRRPEARAVAALRKPAQAAWHLNRLAREDPQTFRRALDARVRLQEVQQSVFAGDKTAAELRAGIRAERDAFDAVLAAIRRVDGEIGDTVSQRVRETLQAAGDDTALHDDALAGRLISELRPEPVWPQFAGEPAQPDEAPRSGDESEPEPEPERAPEPAEDAKTEAQIRRDAERARKEHEQEIERARKRTQGAESDADRAAARSERAAATRRRAEARLAEAVTAERDALMAEREAAKALETLRSELGESDR